jgi:uncharacterized RDD family membrane protein YckC
MKCQGCGHEYPNTISRCPRCRLSSRRGSRSSDSRLIEFPRKARTISQSEPQGAALPAWRVELNERVRAVKARRGNSPTETETLPVAAADLNEVERGKAPVRQEEFNQTTSIFQSSRPVRSTARGNDSIVEAALTRVRKASENASRAALPKIEPAKPTQQTKGALAVDREATARALEPTAEIRPKPAPRTIPLQEVSQPRIERQEPVEVSPLTAAPLLTEQLEVKHAIDSQDSVASTIVASAESPRILVLDEIEPMDYLEAEIRKVDQALSKEFAKNDSPAIGTHLVLNVIDLFIIALSCSPFLALVLISNGSLETTETRLAMGGIIALVTFLYLALTQCLCGKTFGMMFTGTRILEARTSEPPSVQRALARSAGYFVAAAPALLGILWAAGDRKRRGWQDLIAGTIVVHDY